MKSKGSVEPVLPLTGPRIAVPAPLLYTAAGVLTNPSTDTLRRDDHKPHHRRGRAGPDDKGLEELALPLA